MAGGGAGTPLTIRIRLKDRTQTSCVGSETPPSLDGMSGTNAAPPAPRPRPAHFCAFSSAGRRRSRVPAVPSPGASHNPRLRCRVPQIHRPTVSQLQFSEPARQPSACPRRAANPTTAGTRAARRGEEGVLTDRRGWTPGTATPGGGGVRPGVPAGLFGEQRRRRGSLPIEGSLRSIKINSRHKVSSDKGHLIFPCSL